MIGKLSRLGISLYAASITLGVLPAIPHLAFAQSGAGLIRPPLAAACQAMQAHIADLLDQHRRSDDLDDAAFDSVLRLFYEAQSACTLGRFSEGLDLYSAIPIGRVSHSRLR